MTTVEKPFDPAFNYAFQPKEGPPDNWTAEIGGNNLECFIVKESLTIRMGKDDPELLNQADAGTASFEIRGEPLRWAAHQSIGWNTNAFTGSWTDAPRATSSVVDAHTTRYEPSSSPDWSSAELAGKTFLNITEAAINAPGVTAKRMRAAAYTQDFNFYVWKQPGVSVGQGIAGHLVFRYYTANPWNAGGVLLDELVGPQHTIGTNAYVVSMPEHEIPFEARWVQIIASFSLASTTDTVYRVQVQERLTGRTLNISQALPDAFEPGEKVVIRRNNLTIWTGWVTDTQREWAPSTGSIWTVNAAGPRAFYNRRKYVPRFGNVYGTDPNVAAFPHDIGQDGNVNWPLQYTIDELSSYFTMGIDSYLTAESQSLQTGTTFIYPGTELFPVMELLDAAANCVFGQVWEKRDGRIYVYGHAYFRYEAPPSWYDSDRVILNCDDIGAPVEIRNEPSYINSWSAKCRLEVVGTPVGDNSTPPDPVIQEYYEPLTNQFLAVREYNISPVAPINEFHADVKWDFMQDVYSRNIESIDRWTIRKEFVDDAVWTDLLTILLGWPVRITNIPDGVFLDGTTEFNGFLWGWELRGTEEVDLILVDQRLFK